MGTARRAMAKSASFLIHIVSLSGGAAMTGDRATLLADWHYHVLYDVVSQGCA